VKSSRTVPYPGLRKNSPSPAHRADRKDTDDRLRRDVPTGSGTIKPSISATEPPRFRRCSGPHLRGRGTPFTSPIRHHVTHTSKRQRAVNADLLSRLGRTGESAAAYRQALALAANEAERAFLTEQIADHTLSACGSPVALMRTSRVLSGLAPRWLGAEQAPGSDARHELGVSGAAARSWSRALVSHESTGRQALQDNPGGWCAACRRCLGQQAARRMSRRQPPYALVTSAAHPRYRPWVSGSDRRSTTAQPGRAASPRPGFLARHLTSRPDLATSRREHITPRLTWCFVVAGVGFEPA
jgi:hypothetical protein